MVEGALRERRLLINDKTINAYAGVLQTRQDLRQKLSIVEEPGPHAYATKPRRAYYPACQVEAYQRCVEGGDPIDSQKRNGGHALINHHRRVWSGLVVRVKTRTCMHGQRCVPLCAGVALCARCCSTCAISYQ